MFFIEMLEGTAGRTYFSSLYIMILSLMTAMSVRLFLSRRRRSYFYLTVFLLIGIFQNALQIAADSGESSSGGLTGYFALLLKAVSLILLNFGVYRLYNAARFRQIAATLLALLGAVGFSLTRFAFDGSAGTSRQILLLQGIGIELYLFLVLFLCYQWITPRIGQWGKYRFSLILYFAYQLMHVSDLYLLEGRFPVFSTLILFMPVLYYGTLFLILFERVVELLQATYTKSITDALTGLYNRRFFMNRVQQYLDHGVPVSVIFSDIDNFKKLNDTQGHDKGDEALKKVASILKERAEDCGIAGRLGGEEMAVLVTDPDVPVSELAEAIRSGIESDAGVTASIGFSKARKGMTAETLVKQADEAMYQAKTTGKNKVCRYMRQKQLQL